MRALLILSCLALAACGSTPERAQTAREAAAEPVEPARPPPTPVRNGTIARAELDQVLAGGIGRFLQHVTTEPHLEEGRFVGFRLRELDEQLFGGVDLSVGDTLVSVNGSPIERPEQALSVWNGLRVASELTIEYLREGERRQVRFEIAD